MRGQHSVASVVMSPSLISDSFLLIWGTGVTPMHVQQLGPNGMIIAKRSDNVDTAETSDGSKFLA